MSSSLPLDFPARHCQASAGFLEKVTQQQVLSSLTGRRRTESGSQLLALKGSTLVMAATGLRKRLQEKATCPVCLEYFTNPVSLDCGHNFCQACIIQSWGEPPIDATCPQCRDRVQSSNLRLNRHLTNMVEIVKELSEPQKLETEGWRVRKRHQEPLKLFCQDDQAPICLVCDRSKEHRGHRVVPVEKAAQEYKDQICSHLEVLRKEREKIVKYIEGTEKESKGLLKQTEEERKKIMAEFRRLHQFLEKKEKLLLAQVEEVKKEIATIKNKRITTLSEELSTLESIIQEMEEKCQQEASEFLEDVRSTLQWKEMNPENPVTFPAALKWRIWELWDVNSFLANVMGQFEDTVVAGLQLQKANVTLNPATAHPTLFLFGDCKSMRGGDKHQDLPDNPQRFDMWPAVLGQERFTAGRHFWEVTVEAKGTWAVGVASKHARRKGYFDFSPEEGIWLLEKWAFENRDLRFPDSLSFPTRAKSQRVRVILNQAGGQVTFFDADSATLLYSISDALFSGETIYPFFLLYGKAHLRVS